MHNKKNAVHTKLLDYRINIVLIDAEIKLNLKSTRRQSAIMISHHTFEHQAINRSVRKTRKNIELAHATTAA